MQAYKVHMILSQTTVFVWIFPKIRSGGNEWMDDNFKPVTMITNLHFNITHVDTWKWYVNVLIASFCDDKNNFKHKIIC